MQPTLSIAVIDGIRRFGNGLVLPAGPLRELLPPCHSERSEASQMSLRAQRSNLGCFARLRLPRNDSQTASGLLRYARNDTGKKHVALMKPHLWVVNGEPKAQDEWPMALRCDAIYQMQTDARKRLADFVGQRVVAIAGIGNPQRFFTMLEALGIEVEAHAFPDHHIYTAQDFKAINPELPWLMTEKDAVKCRRFVPANTWLVPVDAVLPPAFWQALQQRLDASSSP
jgi:tetraacyldisaccharide 4'-kinase